MAYKNKIISNPKTGQSIRFIQSSQDTGGELLEMESSFKAFSKEPPSHYHPFQTEDFNVVKGEIMVRIEGQVTSYKAGESFHVPTNKVHSMWNGSPAETVLNWKVRPALNSEHLFEITAGLANDGRTNENGVPGLLQVALLAHTFSNVFRVARPPYFVQRLLFTILTPVAYLLGYRSTYKKYLE